MGRPRQFNESEALRHAMMVFWRYGFDATTFRMLEDATGVGAKGLGNVLGDKEAIFVKTLRLYRDDRKKMLEENFWPPGLSALKRFLDTLAIPSMLANDKSNVGCMMVASIFELDRTGPQVQNEVETFRHMMLSYFRAALEAEKIDEADAKAEFILSVIWGAQDHLRLKRTKSANRRVVEVMKSTLDAWAMGAQSTAGQRGVGPVTA